MRIIRVCRELGIRTVAVFPSRIGTPSTPQIADEAMHRPCRHRDNYNNVAAILRL